MNQFSARVHTANYWLQKQYCLGCRHSHSLNHTETAIQMDDNNDVDDACLPNHAISVLVRVFTTKLHNHLE